MRLLFLIALLFCRYQAWGYKTHGRLTLGGFSATETFKDDTAGSVANDFSRLTGRFHLRLSDLTTEKYQFTVDLADKYDGFGKLNKAAYQLDSTNVWQTKQLFFSNPNLQGPYYYQIGRFPLVDSGSLTCDGAQVGFRTNMDLSSGIFGGLNPRRIDQVFYTFNPDSNIYGAFVSYHPNNTEWNKNFLLNHSLIQETVKGETDRQYLYHNMFYQWDENSRLLTNLYYDFVPRTYVQNGSVSWQQGWSQLVSTELNYMEIDVISYLRQQNVREELVSSPYRESFAAFRLTPNRQAMVEFKVLQGERSLDGLKKNFNTLGLRLTQIWGQHYDLHGKIGAGKNFISNNTLAAIGIAYYSDKWELSIDESYATETYDSGMVLHPLISELTASRYLSNKLFLSTAVQNIKEERVEIWSAFFKIGYRFGNQEIPPVRDGAPPRGQL